MEYYPSSLQSQSILLSLCSFGGYRRHMDILVTLSLIFLLICISACPVCYLPVEEAIAHMPKFPSPSPVLQNLAFIYEETLSRVGEFGGSDFGGYPTLRQRNESFDIRESMSVHCGYVLYFVLCFPSVYLWVLKKVVCGYNFFFCFSNRVYFFYPFTYFCPFCIYNVACVHHSDLLEELNLAATQDLTWMKMTSSWWSSVTA